MPSMAFISSEVAEESDPPQLLLMTSAFFPEMPSKNAL
jgi:hypothetical protein